MKRCENCAFAERVYYNGKITVMSCLKNEAVPYLNADGQVDCDSYMYTNSHNNVGLRILVIHQLDGKYDCFNDHDHSYIFTAETADELIKRLSEYDLINIVFIDRSNSIV